MTAKDDRKNAEGYNDPTAYNAIKNVEYASEEENRKIHTGRKLKSVKRVPDVKMSTYNYKPAMKRNLPYQRRNF